MKRSLDVSHLIKKMQILPPPLSEGHHLLGAPEALHSHRGRSDRPGCCHPDLWEKSVQESSHSRKWDKCRPSEYTGSGRKQRIRGKFFNETAQSLTTVRASIQQVQASLKLVYLFSPNQNAITTTSQSHVGFVRSFYFYSISLEYVVFALNGQCGHNGWEGKLLIYCVFFVMKPIYPHFLWRNQDHAALFTPHSAFVTSLSEQKCVIFISTATLTPFLVFLMHYCLWAVPYTLKKANN